eukprot:3163490-Pleurochrysis_carterae.AAC.1
MKKLSKGENRSVETAKEEINKMTKGHIPKKLKLDENGEVTANNYSCATPQHRQQLVEHATVRKVRHLLVADTETPLPRPGAKCAKLGVALLSTMPFGAAVAMCLQSS